MELDDLKEEWQRYKAAHLCNQDFKAITAETILLVKQKDRKFTFHQMIRMLCGLLCLGLMVACYRREGPLPANMGSIVMFLCLALMMAGSTLLKYRQRETRYWLPSEKFLAEERIKIVARISLLRRNATWLFIPCISGFLTWQIAMSHSAGMVVTLAAIAAIASAGVFRLYRWKLQKGLLPELEYVDRDLEYEREYLKSWSD